MERAMREVDDARDPEDQRQPRADEEQRRRAGQAVGELDEDGGEGHGVARQVKLREVFATG